jgi:hypothetical protein
MKTTYTKTELAKIENALNCNPDSSDQETFELLLDAIYHMCGMDHRGCIRRLRKALATLERKVKA